MEVFFEFFVNCTSIQIVTHRHEIMDSINDAVLENLSLIHQFLFHENSPSCSNDREH